MVRLLSGLALGVAALAAIYFLSNTALRVLVVAVALLAAHEYGGIADRGARSGPLLYVFVAAVAWLTSDPAPRATLVLVVALALLLVDVLIRARSLSEAGTLVAGGIYVGMPLGFLVDIHRLAGREAVLLLIAVVAVSDSAQYYSGRLLGRHPLAPAISPKKTVEGALGGVVFGVAAMVFVGGLVFPLVSWRTLAILGLVIVLVGICGDLFESRLKRDAGIKDSSSVIPGHGGILDRIDALLFAAPAFYVFLDTASVWTAP